MKLLRPIAIVVALATPAIVFACEGEKTAQKPAVKKISVTQLAELNKDHKAVVLDANGADTRAKMGVIPDAKLLTHFINYDVQKELPAAKDSKLVFYCASTQCGASKQAATKAVEAGYTDVNILPDGIKGWKDAGQPTKALPQS